MTKLEFADTVDALCKRPAANTLHGTLPEVLAYLDGLAKGNGLQPGSHWRTSGFFNWLSKNLGKDTIRDDELLLRSELRRLRSPSLRGCIVNTLKLNWPKDWKNHKAKVSLSSRNASEDEAAFAAVVGTTSSGDLNDDC